MSEEKKSLPGWVWGVIIVIFIIWLVYFLFYSSG